MAGISGSSTEAADSIVVSGGYEDDEDHGDFILYTGQGGNDPATGKQIYDQELVRGNLALVRNMVEGIPVRVVRGSNHISPHSPRAGYSYDGLFRVERFWHDVGRSGFRIWRYQLRKVSPEPAASVPPLGVNEERELYGTETPKRAEVTVSRVIRNTPVTTAVKQMHDYTCQVCGIRLETRGGPYAEAAHIRPLGSPHNGPDTVDNILCLCPNDHLLFDVGATTIEDDLTISGTQQKLRTIKGHPINRGHLRYHREHFG
jgi:putative restriction endonuclease